MMIHHRHLHGNLRREHKVSPMYATRAEVARRFKVWNKGWSGTWRFRIIRVGNHAGKLLGYAAVVRPKLGAVR
jgi:hypothetical protein